MILNYNLALKFLIVGLSFILSGMFVAVNTYEVFLMKIEVLQGIRFNLNGFTFHRLS